MTWNRHANIVFVFILLLIDFAGVWAGERRTISLDGTWQVAEGSMSEVPSTFDHTVPVPGVLDLASPPFETLGSVVTDQKRGKPWERLQRSDPLREAFWYRRTFKVDAPESNVALLKINKARFGAKVFLNGEAVGENLYNFTPGWFDLRPHIKTDGSENELVIRVGASLAQCPMHISDGWDYEKSRYIPGIYDSVSLIVTSNHHAVVPGARTGSHHLPTGHIIFDNIMHDPLGTHTAAEII